MIREVRGNRIILDSHLAILYGVPTFRFNEAIKRNRHRFPQDFMFRLTPREFEVIRAESLNSSQFAMSSAKHRGAKYCPYAFTEHGAIMAATILNSRQAVQMSVFVIRAFVRMRETLLGSKGLAKKLATLEKELTDRLDSHESAILSLLQKLMVILNPAPILPAPARPRIGFHE
jgi:hypothetical protein